MKVSDVMIVTNAQVVRQSGPCLGQTLPPLASALSTTDAHDELTNKDLIGPNRLNLGSKISGLSGIGFM